MNWIKVEDRKRNPNNFEPIWIYNKAFGVVKGYRFYKNFYIESSETNVFPTYWMPYKPEPPREDE